ncbi:tetracycline 7-halogenase / FADH2 O2-dependent halogenase [Methylacidimicrobium cyclopophantes]|uniref:Tetracycline 7-halogenase / FADH2 O2-dependent halogenase n=1 Tax=Methylacidimicrobium cyclopophantes TaxID=1041766 RepID=A0A5E6MN14_9BACT|nr:NAD(P)/FAD-dependent oxidoreductase [Methylacidimicrobium cyclopophantes]VVM07422.1 tetracycline 7-halogenase / FADH2 O2-dependent halogenase [Methylacidimicrobium cyclopophantes]
MSDPVIIVGGGPAGSAAASLLARQGTKVVLLEKETFPRFHIGESLLPFANRVLVRIGAWEKIKNAGFMIKPGAEFVLSNGMSFRRFWFADSLAEPYDKTFQVERAKFDALLLDHAKDSGATILSGATARGFREGRDGVEVDCERAGKRERVEGRWLIDATGREPFLSKVLNLPRTDLGIPKKMAVYAHFRNVRRNPGRAAGNITVVRLPNGWFWFIPLDEEKTSVGMVRPLSEFQDRKSGPRQLFEETVRKSRELRFRLEKAEAMSPYRTTADYTYRLERLAGSRWLAAGDAAGFLDPVFSSGVTVALEGGVAAAEMILRQGDEPNGLSAAEQREFTQRIHSFAQRFAEMIRIFYDDRAFEVLMTPHPPPAMKDAIIHLLAGSTDLHLSLWLRIKLFYLLCGIQRHLRLAPALDFRSNAGLPANSPVST